MFFRPVPFPSRKYWGPAFFITFTGECMEILEGVCPHCKCETLWFDDKTGESKCDTCGYKELIDDSLE